MRLMRRTNKHICVVLFGVGVTQERPKNAVGTCYLHQHYFELNRDFCAANDRVDDDSSDDESGPGQCRRAENSSSTRRRQRISLPHVW